MLRPSRFPLWLRVAIVATLLLLEHALWHVLLGDGADVAGGLPVRYAFWQFIAIIAGYIWDGLQTAYDAVVTALVGVVHWLIAFSAVLYNGIVKLGSTLANGFKAAWGFFRTVYDDVLKPAWQKFWTLFDRVRTWLNKTFGPVLRFLRTVRAEMLKFYKQWIRPVLDFIDAVRQVLRVLEALHIKIAQQLDASLAQLEAAIDKPFQIALAKINEVINLVNRIVTLDGLFQRLAFIRTLQRDVLYASRVFTNARSQQLTHYELGVLSDAATLPETPALCTDIGAYLNGERNDAGDSIDAIVAAVLDDLPAYVSDSRAA